MTKNNRRYSQYHFEMSNSCEIIPPDAGIFVKYQGDEKIVSDIKAEYADGKWMGTVTFVIQSYSTDF